MDENELNKLSPELQQRFKEYEDMFATPGWERLMVELRERAGMLVNSALDTINDEKGLYFAKGQLRSALAIINLEAGIQAEYQTHLDVLESDQEEAEASKGSNS